MDVTIYVWVLFQSDLNSQYGLRQLYLPFCRSNAFGTSGFQLAESFIAQREHLLPNHIIKSLVVNKGNLN